MEILTPEQIARLNRLQLFAKQTVEGFLTGLHKSPYHGFSVEFADHRQYNPGDPLKNVDWRIVARTGRYYVKRYEEETNLNCYILLDHSASMDYGSEGDTKLDFAKRLAASLTWLMINQKDAVGLYTFDDEITFSMPPKALRSYSAEIFGRLIRLEAGKKTNLAKPLEKISERIKKRSLIVIISDLLDEEENILRAFKHFRNKGHELLVFHLFDKSEEQFDFKHESEFIDSETSEKLIINPWQIKAEYQKNFQAFFANLKEQAHQMQVEYNPISTNDTIEDMMLRYLSKRKKGL